MVDTTTAALPDYKNPPVIETVLGVQFDRLPQLKNAHLGAFWNTLNLEEWPNIADAPLLPPQFEQFGVVGGWSRSMKLQLTDDPACRVQIKNANGDRMVQVQNGRMHLNWLGQQGLAYPRYEQMRGEFITVFEQFQQYIVDFACGDLRPNQWEITYVNQIPRDTVWKTVADWGFFLPLRGIPAVEHVVQGESFGGEWHFTIPGERGRLHIEWRHGKGTSFNKQDDDEIIRITLTARGPTSLKDREVPAILEGLDLGRATIVQAFRNLMSDEANRYWGLKNAC